MNKEQFYTFIAKIPKAEIHIHSEALISRQTAREILSRKDPKYNDINAVNNLFNYANLKGFIKAFLLLQSVFNDISDFEKLYSNILPYLKRNGIVHAELYFSPSIFVMNGLKFTDIIKTFIKQIKEIKKNEKLDIKIIIDVSRTFGIENALRNLNAAIKCECNEIIGIGLGGDEKKGPARNFQSIFKRAENFGLHRVAHAGEDVGSKSIWDALNFLNVQRIGHGIASIQDEKLINYLIEKQIPLEICPTSNVFTKKFVKTIEEHPIKELYNRGVMVTLNTDDPTFFNIELIDEYWNLYSKLGFKLEDIKKVIINGFNASFIESDEKLQYIKMVNDAWSKYLPK